MLTLYHSPHSRSSRIIWLLEEIGTPYELVYVSIRRGDGSGAPDAHNVHPDKKVPALMHDGNLVTESGAICLYLSDLFSGAGLGPKAGDTNRAAYLSWLFFYAAEGEPAIAAKMLGHTETDPRAAAQYSQVVQRVLHALKSGPYMMGERFTTVDILFGSMAEYARDSLPADPVIDAYAKRLRERPAMARAIEKDAPKAA